MQGGRRGRTEAGLPSPVCHAPGFRRLATMTHQALINSNNAQHLSRQRRVLVQGGEAWEVRGRLACQALSVLRQLFYLVPRADNARAVLRHFLDSALQALQALQAHSSSGADCKWPHASGQCANLRASQLSRCTAPGLLCETEHRS